MNELEYLKKYLHKDVLYEDAVKRLNNGEPVQYIVGDVNFYGNIIKVNKNVLIPRRETEELVEKTIDYINKYIPNAKSLLDLCTGSGCIAITIKKKLKYLNVVASDVSEKALDVAVDNAKCNGVNINFVCSDIFSKMVGKYDCIISNPPYIREDEEIMDVVKNNEPHIALYAPCNGLYFYREILSQAKKFLNEKFIIALEIGDQQGNDVVLLAKKYFPKALIFLEKDLQHLDRFVFVISE